MGLRPGMTNNRKGKPKGTKNKVGKELRQMIVDFVTGEVANIRKNYSKLSPKDKLTFLKDVMPYGISKLSQIDLDLGFEKLTDEQLDYMLDQLKKTIHEQQS